MQRLRIGLVAGLVVLAGCGSAGAHAAQFASPTAGPAPRSVVNVPPPLPDPPLRTLWVGDSLTVGLGRVAAGYGYRQDVLRAWARVEGSSGARRDDVVVATGGWTASQAWQALQQRGVPTARQLVVVELGTNDARPVLHEREVDWQHAYTAILTAARAASPGARLICLGVWGEDDATPAANGLSFGDYDAWERQQCVAHGGTWIALAPLFATAGDHDDLRRGDRFHPNYAGYAAIAGLVERAWAARDTGGGAA